MVIYGLKNCDTCRAAAKALGARLVDIRAEPLSDAARGRFVAAFGDGLVNRRSATWRGLTEAERAMAPDALLAAYPAVMKRPVIEAEGALHLGWEPEVRVALGV